MKLSGRIKKLLKKHISYQQSKQAVAKIERLTNKTFTLICSNCAGGILYHELGLEFRSPFINLFLGNEDFLYVLENLNDFLESNVVEDLNADKAYPVGIGLGGVRIHFMHYHSFQDALEKWNTRKQRVDTGNMVIMLTNFSGERSVLERFDRLPFANKIVFTSQEYPEFDSVVCLKGYRIYSKIMKKLGVVPNIWGTRNPITGTRYIDQFDYISYFNDLKG